MKKIKELIQLLDQLSDDPKVGPGHISLLACVFRAVNEKDDGGARLFVKDILRKAKISRTTYHRCIWQLHQFGYIHYEPSCDPALGNKIILQNKNREAHDEKRRPGGNAGCCPLF